MVKTFCEECLAVVDADVSVVSETVPIRGVELEVRNEYPVCPQCGARIADPRIMEANLARAYDAYRQHEGIPTPEALRDLRGRAGWSQRQFSCLLGIGLASLQRYEQGSLPTESHGALLKKAFDPSFLRERLRDIAPSLSERDKSDLSWGIDAAFGSGWGTDAYRSAVLGFLPSNPSSLTGDMPFFEDRLRETLVYFANHVRNLYKTKLNKVLFYLDFSMQRDRGRGFTGLRYARAPYGPVPDGFEEWMPVFIDGSTLYYEECESGGQIVRSRRLPCLESFSEEEQRQLEAVVGYVNGFPTASDLSRASHEEDAWIEVGQGALIDYSYAATLKGVTPPR